MTPDEPLPREDITATCRGGTQHGLEVTVDLHRDHEFTHKPTGERYRRCAEAPDHKLRFYFDLVKPAQ